MANFNKVILAGNLTRDPELRYTSSGVAIAKLSIAINRNWRSESGESREETTFVEVDAFRKQAETIGQYLKKGRPILVEGRLKLDQWEDKQSGQKRSKLSVVMENFQFLDSGGSGGGGGGGGGRMSDEAPPTRTRPSPTQNVAPPPNDGPSGGGDGGPPEDDDVPF